MVVLAAAADRSSVEEALREQGEMPVRLGRVMRGASERVACSGKIPL
jgi:hypothetical protein